MGASTIKLDCIYRVWAARIAPIEIQITLRDMKNERFTEPEMRNDHFPWKKNGISNVTGLARI